MLGVERLKQVEGLAAANLTDQNPIGLMPQRRSQQVANGHGRQVRLLATGLAADKIRGGHLELRGLFDQDQPIVGR
jgi:hypothetical protein